MGALHLLILLAVSTASIYTGVDGSAAKDDYDMLRGPIHAPPGNSFNSFAGNPDRRRGYDVSSHRHGRATEGEAILVNILAGVFGFATSLLLSLAIWNRCISRPSKVTHSPIATTGERGNLLGRIESLQVSLDRITPTTISRRLTVQLTPSDLLHATADFHPDRIIAVGSAQLGTSYKAVLSDGTALTIKRLRSCRLFDEAFYSTMISHIGRLRHPNLAPLLDFYAIDDERLLVYKHMPKGALSSLLHSSSRSLGWPARLKIAIGAARGLTWLHHWFHAPLIHHYMSSSTILLDEDYEAKITDFGLSGLLESNVGELGYAAPEYAANPVPTTKGDVYALGVVLLELATGRKPGEIGTDAVGVRFAGNLVDWVRKLAGEGRIRDAVDESLRGKGHDIEIVESLKIAMGCVVNSPQERFSMYGAYRSLRNIGDGYGFLEQFEEIPLVRGADGGSARD
uniref:Protein kinase domain-containing protein n=1 Tax=Ananas comosus var. bracteatus TaxID=296719 RepID=A0A6V7Q245_ANACO|nr:unnamed protein product [Ananas comosus var. bracteatus]